MVQYLEIHNFKDVKKISKINNSLKSKKCNIIAIYLTGCGFCQLLHPEWKKAANKMKNANGTISYVNTEFQNNLNINTSEIIGFPYIVAIKNNKQMVYNGERDANSLYNWMSSICPSKINKKKTQKRKKKQTKNRRKLTRRKK